MLSATFLLMGVRSTFCLGWLERGGAEGGGGLGGDGAEVSLVAGDGHDSLSWVISSVLRR